MAIQKTADKLLPTIGIECHVQLKTKTKLFAAVANDAREAPANSLICHICLGMPGALPVLNAKAVELAARMAFALNTTPQTFSKFDRKHYFYPDLPKGYQISQYDQPIILGGWVTIGNGLKAKKIGITRAHLEEDAGKSSHPEAADYSLVDLNRAGTPLLEIVSEPQMHSAAEAKAFAKELYLLAKYSDVSDADLYYGNMRFDVNVSLAPEGQLGIRSETKNLNSFKSVEKAIEYEIKRQTDLINKGHKVVQETRGWDDAKQKTFSQRTKEDAHDYRYFPDPDIPPVVLDHKYITTIKQKLPLLPSQIRDALAPVDLDPSVQETIVENLPAGLIMYQIVQKSPPAISRLIANWLATVVQGYLAESGKSWLDLQLETAAFIELAQMQIDGNLSSSNAKKALIEYVINGQSIQQIIKDLNLVQVNNSTDLKPIVKLVIKQNPQAVSDWQAGQAKALGFLTGQVMKVSQGQANPSASQKLLLKYLKK